MLCNWLIEEQNMKEAAIDHCAKPSHKALVPFVCSNSTQRYTVCNLLCIGPMAMLISTALLTAHSSADISSGISVQQAGIRR
jgi:hypothetical protein